MKYFDLKLIQQYINGDNIGKYKLEELENNKDFMMCVINTTNDPDIYYLCSNEIKINYDFMKFYINKFIKNSDKVIKAFNYFIKHSTNNHDKIILAMIIASKYSKYTVINFEYDEFLFYFLQGYYYDTLSFEDVYKAFKKHKDLDIILNIIAKKQLSNILNEKELVLPYVIMHKFNTVQELLEYGTLNFLIIYIKAHDIQLGKYVSDNTDLLDIYLKDIDNIIDNWDYYKQKDKNKRFNNIIRNIYNYCNEYQTIIPPDEYIKYLSTYINNNEFINYYIDFLDNQDSSINDLSIDKLINHNIKQQLHLENIKRIINNQLNTNIPKPYEEVIKISKDNKERKKHLI